MLIADGSYRLLKFSGDMDMSVPSLGTQGWIDALEDAGKIVEDKPWREYVYKN